MDKCGHQWMRKRGMWQLAMNFWQLRVATCPLLAYLFVLYMRMVAGSGVMPTLFVINCVFTNSPHTGHTAERTIVQRVCFAKVSPR